MGIEKPKKRSRFRRWLGKRYFIGKRYYQWWRRANQFAKERQRTLLPCEVITHQSVLLRKLKDVDMHLQHNKIINLKLAAAQISGLIIRPGETFSFWYLVGAPSQRKGYQLGMTLEGGLVKQGIGGGICQMGNLIYWMALHTPLTVVERWRHSYDVFPDVQRTLPFGSGATLAYNYIDLQIKNETQQAFQLQLSFSETHLRGAFYSEVPIPFRYQVEERNHIIQGEVWGAYSRHNQIFRVVYPIDSSKLLREELITENHALMMYQPFLEHPKEEK